MTNPIPSRRISALLGERNKAILFAEGKLDFPNGKAGIFYQPAPIENPILLATIEFDEEKKWEKFGRRRAIVRFRTQEPRQVIQAIKATLSPRMLSIYRERGISEMGGYTRNPTLVRQLYERAPLKVGRPSKEYEGQTHFLDMLQAYHGKFVGETDPQYFMNPIWSLHIPVAEALRWSKLSSEARNRAIDANKSNEHRWIDAINAPIKLTPPEKWERAKRYMDRYRLFNLVQRFASIAKKRKKRRIPTRNTNRKSLGKQRVA
ncbi:MAG: hypothetical protein IPJ89_02180 [Candidatus Iainarchaeum archaeon]|uniref:Uncharacterized protein n=1 Tax=Candidatus Iainarchaeum sp. TaxID=3101447 RepID=A0A7T9DKJ9_9ARCH|nr:MAG: hypothetical protein IPJ89_02180 [Candidatus Diapherotrites archaeon]